MINIEKRDDGVAVLTIDTPGSQNTLDQAFNTAFDKAIEELHADESIKGIVVTSGKGSFAAGGDLDQLIAANTPDAVIAIVEPFLSGLRKLETGGKPVVAALNGTALGGGLELALAAHHRIAADRPDAIFGLPESSLGLMPGGGGTQRLPRMIGMDKAAKLILTGKPVGVAEALQLGVIDEVVPAGDLIAASIRWILANPEAVQPWDVRGFVMPGNDPNSTRGRMFFGSQWARYRTRSGTDDLAGATILYVLHHGLERRIDAGIKIETREFAKLAASPYAKNKTRTLFFGTKAARPHPSKNAGDNIKKIGIVGGGTMGNGIAFTCAREGLKVVLVDISAEMAATSYDRIKKIAERQVSRGRMSDKASEELLARIQTTEDYANIADADFVVEAVFEQLDVKHQVYKKLEAVLRPEVTIASNTSSMLIEKLGAGLADPSRMVGMHFFAPVEVMKLLEIIRSPQTSDLAFDQAQFIAKKMKKTQISVSDGLGFYTSRLVSSLSSEAMTLLAEGVPPQIIDNVMTSLGFAIGPVTLAELTKLSLLKDIMISMSGEGSPKSMIGSRALEALEKLVDAGRDGSGSGKGIYDYSEDGPTKWAGLEKLFPANPDPLSVDLVRQRLLNTQSLEAVRTIEDGIIADPLAADVASVLGWGYPAHLGGPIGYIDTVGAKEFSIQCEALAKQFGERFNPPASLKTKAQNNALFHTA